MQPVPGYGEVSFVTVDFDCAIIAFGPREFRRRTNEDFYTGSRWANLCVGIKSLDNLLSERR